jgi:hypothetical protein
LRLRARLGAFAPALLALVTASCGGSSPVEGDLEPIARTAPRAERDRVATALHRLERLHATGALAHLQSGVCGEGPEDCRPPGQAEPGEDPEDVIGQLAGVERQECPERCVEEWQELRAAQEALRELSRTSREPRILVPFRRAVRRLSPDPGEPTCDAAPDSLVRAQAAVLAYLFELDPVPLRPIYSEAGEGQLGCLRVPTLSGHVPVEHASHAEREAAGHGNAIHSIGEPTMGGDEPVVVDWAERTTVVEVSFYCGPLCGGGDDYLVAYAGGEWRVVDEWHAWDS